VRLAWNFGVEARKRSKFPLEAIESFGEEFGIAHQVQRHGRNQDTCFAAQARRKQRLLSRWLV